MKQELELGDFCDFVRIDEDDFKKALGLELDDDGNIYDPLSKDLDNDCVSDRYDNDLEIVIILKLLMMLRIMLSSK